MNQEVGAGGGCPICLPESTGILLLVESQLWLHKIQLFLTENESAKQTICSRWCLVIDDEM